LDLGDGILDETRFLSRPFIKVTIAATLEENLDFGKTKLI
jgi:hypothetical protein